MTGTTGSAAADLPAEVLQWICSVCDRYETAWKTHDPAAIAQWLRATDEHKERFPELRDRIRDRLLRELLPAEIGLCQDHGSDVDVQSLLLLFPAQEGRIRELVEAKSDEAMRVVRTRGTGGAAPC